MSSKQRAVALAARRARPSSLSHPPPLVRWRLLAGSIGSSGYLRDTVLHVPLLLDADDDEMLNYGMRVRNTLSGTNHDWRRLLNVV